jgi:hypothetical protein
MSLRYQVTRAFVLHKRVKYNQGDYLPKDFTERDKARNVYSRRIALVEVKDNMSKEETLTRENPPMIPPIDAEQSLTSISSNASVTSGSQEIEDEKENILTSDTDAEVCGEDVEVKQDTSSETTELSQLAETPVKEEEVKISPILNKPPVKIQPLSGGSIPSVTKTTGAKKVVITPANPTAKI